MSASDFQPKSNFNRLGSENKMLQLLQITGILAFLILFMNFCDGASSWHVAYAFSMVNTQLMERSLYFHLNNTGFLNFQRWKWFFSMVHWTIYCTQPSVEWLKFLMQRVNSFDLSIQSLANPLDGLISMPLPPPGTCFLMYRWMIFISLAFYLVVCNRFCQKRKWGQININI